MSQDPAGPEGPLRSAEPVIVQRPAQRYAGIRGTVTMQTIPEIADRIPELAGWLGQHGVPPSGQPFFKYDLIDMANRLDIQVGFPVAGGGSADGDVYFAELPAGRYATVTHVGHPNQLLGATRELLAWAADRRLTWDMTETDAGQRWAARLESYLTDPREEPDLTKWVTELAFRLAD